MFLHVVAIHSILFFLYFYYISLYHCTIVWSVVDGQFSSLEPINSAIMNIPMRISMPFL